MTEPDSCGDAKSRPPLPRPDARHGLCPLCIHVRRITSAKGSTFLLCELAQSDPRFPKYPPQPRLVCSGFAR
jgi:hypothetical protein